MPTAKKPKIAPGATTSRPLKKPSVKKTPRGTGNGEMASEKIPALELSGVVKFLDGKEILKGVSLRVAKGEVF